eukprot:358957-Chlamydomonas_euryale.AAC.1
MEGVLGIVAEPFSADMSASSDMSASCDMSASSDMSLFVPCAKSQSLQRAPLSRPRPGSTALPGYRSHTRKVCTRVSAPAAASARPCHLPIVLRVRVFGSGLMQSIPELSAARQMGSSSGLGATTIGTPTHAVLSHPIPSPPHQPGHTNPTPPTGNWAQS